MSGDWVVKLCGNRVIVGWESGCNQRAFTSTISITTERELHARARCRRAAVELLAVHAVHLQRRHHQVITWSPCAHHVVITRSSRGHHVVIMWSSLGHDAVNMLSSRGNHITWSSCGHHAVITPLSSVAYRSGINGRTASHPHQSRTR